MGSTKTKPRNPENQVENTLKVLSLSWQEQTKERMIKTKETAVILEKG